MKLFCNHCDDYQEVQVQLSGPHKKAVCRVCKRYIKFLTKDEVKTIEDEEDNK